MTCNFNDSNINNDSDLSTSTITITTHDDEVSTEDLLYQYLEPHFVQSFSPASLPDDHEFDATEMIGSSSPISHHSSSSPQTIHDYPVQPYFTAHSLSDVNTTSASIIDDHIQLQITSFSDLQTALKDIGQEAYGSPAGSPQQPMLSLPGLQDTLLHSSHHNQHHYNTYHQHNNSHYIPSAGTSASADDHVYNNDDDTDAASNNSTEEDLVHLNSTDFSVPSSIRLNVESSHMLDSLMQQAVSHWCCIGFKVAPISLDLIRDWHSAPPAIVYCVASISLVTFMDHRASQSFIKQAAMVFYEQARHKMDDVFVEDMQPMIIQAYFCLSYTSNLLRLYEQQRTWGGLASIALQQHAKDIAAGRPVDRMTMMCWLRWYYVDAWMCLTLNRECLLADDTPLQLAALSNNNNDDSDASLSIQPENFHGLFQFAALTQYMRMYIRAIRSGTIFQKGTTSPSPLYQDITVQLKQWYVQQRHTEIHFHLCYHAMRLVILFQFLNPASSPPHDILIDCLETNLALLQALQYLKEIGCDQSTYHHMFFAIHNTAKRIYAYDSHALKHFAEEQLRINLMMLRGTQAYINDVFKVRLYAEKIEQQFRDLQISIEGSTSSCSSIVFNNSTGSSSSSSSSFYAPLSSSGDRPSNRRSLSLPATTSLQPSNSGSPCIFVFRQKPLPTPTTTRVRKSSHDEKIKKASLKRQFSFPCSSKKKKSPLNTSVQYCPS